MYLHKSIGKKLKELRQKKAWTQADVAKRLNMSIPAYSKIETGITDINISRLQQFSMLYSIPVGDIIGYDKDPLCMKNTADIAELNDRIIKRDSEIAELQAKIINLYDEIWSMKG